MSTRRCAASGAFRRGCGSYSKYDARANGAKCDCGASAYCCRRELYASWRRPHRTSLARPIQLCVASRDAAPNAQSLSPVRSYMRRFAFLLALAAVVSCGGDSPTSPSASVSGTYSLQTVNGAALPYTQPQDVYDKFEFLSDVRILSDSGTFTETYTNRQTQNGVATTFSRTVTGTYTVVGGGITFFHPE